jgi:phage tail sheath gpL-like
VPLAITGKDQKRARRVLERVAREIDKRADHASGAKPAIVLVADEVGALDGRNRALLAYIAAEGRPEGITLAVNWQYLGGGAR